MTAAAQWIWVLATVFHLAVFLLVGLHCLWCPRPPQSTLLWLMLTGSFPVAGGLAFLVFGINRVPARVWRRQFPAPCGSGGGASAGGGDAASPTEYWWSMRDAVAVPPPGLENFDRMLERIAPSHVLLGGNRIDIHVDGDAAYPRMLEVIRGARQHVHLQTYILGPDAVGRRVLDALLERARAGVDVRLLYDRFGSLPARLRCLFRPYRHPRLHIVGFTQAGVLKRGLQLNLRNHRKFLIVDGRIGFTGGMNIHAGHLAQPARPAIRDYHFEIAGPLVGELQYTFLRDWSFMTDEPADALLVAANFPPSSGDHGPLAARILNGGPIAPNTSLMDSYFAAFTAARHQILIVTPYFVPPEPLCMALHSAALRGVDVKILLSKVCNHRSVRFASQSHYERLLDAGVRIFERRPPFIHAKALVVDGHFSIVGTANLDERSLKLNYETNLAVMDEGFSSRLKHVVLDDLAAADEVDAGSWRRRSSHRRLAENFFALMSPVL